MASSGTRTTGRTSREILTRLPSRSRRVLRGISPGGQWPLMMLTLTPVGRFFRAVSISWLVAVPSREILYIAPLMDDILKIFSRVPLSLSSTFPSSDIINDVRRRFLRKHSAFRHAFSISAVAHWFPSRLHRSYVIDAFFLLAVRAIFTKEYTYMYTNKRHILRYFKAEVSCNEIRKRDALLLPVQAKELPKRRTSSWDNLLRNKRKRVNFHYYNAARI